jgi:hypothetical protein
MFEQIRAHLFVFRAEDAHCVVEWSARTEIQMILAWLEHARAAGLVAIHANVICKPWRQSCGVYDAGIAIL